MIIEFLILMMCSIIASLTTFELNIRFKQGPIRSSAVIAMIIGGFFYFFPTILPQFYTDNIPLYVIGGTFIGMVSSTMLFAILLHYTSQIFNGYGGALGTTACIALMCTMAFPIITKNKKVTYGYRLLRVMFKKRKRKKVIKLKV